MPSPKRTRRWPLRLAQLSPLLGLTVVAAIWFSVPLRVATTLAGSISGPTIAVTPKMRQDWLDLERDMAIARRLHLGNMELENATEQAWTEWVDSLPPRPDESAVLSPTADLDPRVFDAVRKWERVSGARVWSWVTLAPPQPAVIASGTGDPASLNLVEAEFRGQQLIADQSAQPAPKDLVQWLWRQNVAEGGKMRALNPSLLQGEGGGYGGGGMFATSYGLREGGQTWRAVTVFPEGGVDWTPPAETIEAVTALDPTAPDFQQQIAELTKKHRLNIWVFGPLEWKSVPLLVPEGSTTDDANALAARVWPTMAIPQDGMIDSSIPRAFSPAVAKLAGGTSGTMRVTGINNTAYGAGTMYEPDEIPPQTVAWLAVFDEPPAARPTRLAQQWDRWQRFVSGWFPFLLGGAVAFLALTLVVSPVAFAYERRLIARERVREEMARMRRDAHDKVYNRLSALSKRVAAASDQLASDATASLAAIAEDIRGTVGELQEILGDEVRHTNGVLTTVPLAEQLAAVCRAQSARLGVSAECVAGPGLPDTPADLGWDLQCVAEEAITNAVRHGAATTVEVGLVVEGDTLVLRVTDDGSGSAVTKPEDAGQASHGLRGIEQRLGRHAGNLQIESSESGTTLSARIPLR
jgi:two-component sensor histidine kinase